MIAASPADAILQDPEGGVFPAIQMSDELPSPDRSRDHGSLYCDQLLTGEGDRVAKFYGKVCGWTVDQYEMGDKASDYYGVFKRGDRAGDRRLRRAHPV